MIKLGRFDKIKLPRSTVYLPIVLDGVSFGERDKFLNEKSYQLYQLIKNHPDQQRGILIPSVEMNLGASFKSSDLGVRSYFNHISPDGITPNLLARTYGVTLPSYYPTVGNSIESLLAGTDSPEVCLAALLRSKNHRDHLLGLNDFFKRQNHIGVGFTEVAFSPYRYYWCIWIGEL